MTITVMNTNFLQCYLVSIQERLVSLTQRISNYTVVVEMDTILLRWAALYLGGFCFKCVQTTVFITPFLFFVDKFSH